MANQMMNRGSDSGFSILLDKTYSISPSGTTNAYGVNFVTNDIPNWERLTKDNIICGIVTADGSGTESVSISEVEYRAPQITVHLSATGSGRMTVYVNCKVIG